MMFPFAAAFAAFLASVGGPVAPAQAVSVEALQAVPLIEPAALDHLMKAQIRVYLLDVRRPDEFAQGHIQGAVLMPLDTLPAAYRQIPQGVKLVVYCRSGHRSAQAVQFLQAHGYSRAVSLHGGYMAWSALPH
jgi:phage shock protein E